MKSKKENLLDDLKMTADLVKDKDEIVGYHLLVITSDEDSMIVNSDSHNFIMLLGALDLMVGDLRLKLIASMHDVNIGD